MSAHQIPRRCACGATATIAEAKRLWSGDRCGVWRCQVCTEVEVEREREAQRACWIRVFHPPAEAERERTCHVPQPRGSGRLNGMRATMLMLAASAFAPLDRPRQM